MALTWNGVELFYNQIVKVVLAAVDMDKKKLAFEWVDESVSKSKETHIKT